MTVRGCRGCTTPQWHPRGYVCTSACCLWVVTCVIDKTPLCLNPPHFPPLPQNVNSLHHRNVIPNPLICLDYINIFQLKLPFSPSYCLCLFFFSLVLLLLFSCLFILFSIRTKLEAISWQTDALQFRSACELELGVLWARRACSLEILLAGVTLG